MHEIETRILIEATPEKVWQVLMDFEDYPAWNPFITSISGIPARKNKLKITVKPPGGNPMTFRPEILVCEEQQELRWLGKLGIAGFFDGEHYFELNSIGEVGTSLTHGERFRGILVPLFNSTLKKTRVGFELMNNALKKTCETR